MSGTGEGGVLNCAGCAHEIAATAKFCPECGARVAATRCAGCNAELLPGAKFCAECGAATGAGPSSGTGAGEERTPQPQRPPRDVRTYTPQHLADRILQSRAALEGERKQVTVLFADVKGSMELAEQLGAEAWHGVLDRFFEILGDGVHRFEGTVNQYTGDGIMALFGAPIAHEDHAQRACFAALALRDSLAEFARDLKRRHGLDFATRIGLNSGEVVVGKIGDDLRMDYTAQGHTVGLAQRMEGLASGGSIYLSPHTAKLAELYFALNDLGEFTIKGVAQPMHVYELTGTGPARTRFDLSRARGLVRFVGRDAETRTLEAALERTRRGEGQVLGIVADAGTGKSRLCFEFAERCRAQNVRVLEGRCVAHGKNLPLLPVLEVIRGYFDIDHDDSDRSAREKIAGRLLLLDESYRDELPILFEFLGAPDPERPAPPLPPEARQRRLFALLRRLMQAGGATGEEVTLITFEDLHWIDAASEAWVAEMVNAALGGRTLLLLNFRPEYRADFTQRAHYQQLALQPLTADAIGELIADLIGSDPSTEGLARRIHTHTGGNPFFAEEVVQTLVESGQLTGVRGAYQLATDAARLDVPPTVQALLAARIDRLPEREKRVLQSAAVIGKDFAEPLLAAVVGLPERELADALARLRSGEFLHEKSLYPIAEYSFKHPLTQAVAQDSLLGERRRALHAAVARATLEAGGNLDEQAALLAHHFEAAEEAEPAAEWHRRAAEWIAGSNAVQATHHWQRVRALADRIENAALASELGERARTMILEYAWRRGISQQEADELLVEGEAWARRQSDPCALARLYNSYSIAIALGLGQLARALEVCEVGLALARDAGDEPLTFALELRVALVTEYTGDIRAARRAIDAANAHPPAVMEAASPLVGYDAAVFAPAYSAVVAHREGRFDEAIRGFEEQILRARERGATEVLGWLQSYEAEVWRDRGDFPRAVRLAGESLEIGERIESPVSRALPLGTLGRARAHEGDLDGALELAEEWLAASTSTARISVPSALNDLARLRSARGERALARRLANEAIQVSEAEGYQGGRLLAELTLGRIELEDAKPLDAAPWLARAEQSLQATGFFAMAPELEELRAELASQQGDAPARERALREAVRLYREMGATAHVERLDALLTNRDRVKGSPP
jgi:class 3 adenylate cyclase